MHRRRPVVSQTVAVARLTHARRTMVRQWFVRRGVPHLIRDYSAKDTIWTRAASFLVVVFLAELFLTFDPDVSGWAQFGLFAIGVGIVAVAVALVNRLRGRRPFQRPDDIGLLELAMFVVVPPVLASLAADDRPVAFGAWAAVNVGILLLAYVVTSFALVPMTRWAAGRMWREVGHLGDLLIRSLPLLVLFSAFLFLNAEIWRVAHDFDTTYFLVVVAGIVALGSVFVVVFLAREVLVLGSFETWDEVCALCRSSPLASVEVSSLEGVPSPEPLRRLERVNLALVMFVSLAIQIVLVVLGVWLLYLLFGLFTVRLPTISSWITEPVPGRDLWLETDAFGPTIAITRHLVLVSGFIATFAGFQFTVSVLTDTTYRREFADDLADEIRESLAVRTLSRELAGS